MRENVTRDQRRVLRADHLALGPYGIWAVLFILVPLVFVAYYAFTDVNFQFTLENIQRFFTATSSIVQDDGSSAEVRTYLLIFWRSLKLAIISTLVCLVLAYPLAYIMARAEPKVQKTFMTIIMIPMWMNFLIRTYAWMTILQDKGIFNNILSALHLPGVHIIGTEAAVVIGMVYDYLPYMIMPIYSIMAKMDNKLLEAAKALRETLGELPILATFRTAKEGGHRPVTDESYARMIRTLAESGLVDLMDIEAFTGDELVGELVDFCHRQGVKVVLSNHDFDKTPP